jgi:DNA-binding NarL/FixJ family response regulator
MNGTVSGKKVGKVLIVDDCARMREAIRSVVQDLAEQIVEAEDGGAAIAAYDLHKPDWVTMDVTMRPVDGLTATQRIKARHPLARILIVTVHNTNPFREAARMAGATGYILKDDLRKIRDVIDPSGGLRRHANLFQALLAILAPTFSM